jgi:hypothetical protein
MALRNSAIVLSLLLASIISQAHAAQTKVDVYFGYSRAGANLYAVYTPGMNGWQLAVHIKPMPFVGIEGDVSHYSQTVSGFSQQVTNVMFGPRVTLHAAGFSVFAHGLVGLADQSGTVTTYPSTSYNATSYALGAGGDLPLFLGFKFRVTGDYLGNSKAPPSSYSPSPYRVGAGLAYHF